MDLSSPPDDPAPADAQTPAGSPPPLGAVAAALVEAAARADGALIHVAADERVADVLGDLAAALDPSLQVLVFPPWDCLPYDRASPSPASMGARMTALLALADAPERRRLIVTSPEAVLQRTLPAGALSGLRREVALDQAGEVEALTAFARRTGYREQDEVSEPGDICLRGEVLDIFPPMAAQPCRLAIADGEVKGLQTFDPLTQLTTGGLDRLVLDPASELIAPDTDPDPTIFPAKGPRRAGVEHDLPRLSGALDTLLQHAPGAELSVAPEAKGRVSGLLDQLAASFEAACSLAGRQRGSPPPKPEALYLTAEEAQGLRAAEDVTGWAAQARPVAAFAVSARPLRKAAADITAVLDRPGVAVLAGAPADLGRLVREMETRTGRPCVTAPDWAAVRAAEPGALLRLDVALDRGFESDAPRLLMVTAQDVFGSKAHHVVHGGTTTLEGDAELRFGDVVIHEDHGAGVLRALESVQAQGVERPTARLEYHDGAALLAPVAELRKVWRYGAEADAVALDRLNTNGWAKRRAEVEDAISETARELVALARTRDSLQAAKITPPRRRYERFVSGFPYPLTDDQAAAVEAVLHDLESGRPMNRLVCGDVGFGKTEVALRAAAAVALSGRQVAIAAPTTVLARQHYESFRRRFAELGIEVGRLSRLVAPAEAKATKAALAGGETQIVVGTHALAAKDVAFHDLGLLIIDEEQRFGARLKASLHALAPEAHVLTLTATPIPRTLQAAMVGIQDISVIATPPARRRPVRTLLAPRDPATVRAALQREHDRAGQSFVVTPRIEDIEALRRDLADLVPGLEVLVAHGELPPAEVDEVMIRFAGGQGDVLLATNIIESGLDVPRANTMLVHRPDRFGLAQLHQLRGRVGRGRTQSSAYLLYDPAEPLSEAARSRLETLVAYDRLGAGLAISARDLDIRGAGDLVGEDQAGHLKLIGVALYQWLLERAVRQVRHEPVDNRIEPELALGATGELPQGYVPDAEVRLNLYARLSRLESAKAVGRFAHELEDRFGPLPEQTQTLVRLAALGLRCRALGVLKASAGPKGLALDFLDPAEAQRLAAARQDLETHGARLVCKDDAQKADGMSRLEALLDGLDEAEPEEASRAAA